ncbi:MAG: alpha/beta hydrolase [Phycisphaerales bacterium]|nr:alpha/beta hydrolase [Phycisphaerales bacterium]
MNRIAKLGSSLVACTLAAAAGCNSMSSKPNAEDPMAMAPGMAWRAELAPDMKAVIDELGMMNPKPIESLEPAEARKQPTPADAVMALLKKRGMSTEPEKVGAVKDMQVPGAAGPIAARVYTPSGAGPFPVVVYIHGGGWVIATIDTYDSSARALCNAARAVVVSIEYRKGPEAKFPAAHADAYAAFDWATKNAASINGNPNHVDVAGESAGGNMAISVAMMARDKNAVQPKHVLAVYPVAQLGEQTPSIQQYASAKPLNTPMLAWFSKYYTNGPADMQNPTINLLKANLQGLPPTTIVGAQIDPLQSEGKMLADKMKAAGVDVRYKLYKGVTHEFFGTGAVVPEAKEAVMYGAEGLK